MILLKQNQLDEAVEFLKKGKILVFPTETSYGLGCDATNQNAVNKIFKIKDRTEDKPLLVAVSSVAMAKKYLVWNNTVDNLAKQFWPGSLTVIGQGQGLAKGVVAADGTIAVRVTAFSTLREMAEKLGRPVVATSANLSGAGDVYSAADALKMFAEQENQPDIILDGGELPRRPPTTIVSVVNNEIKIIRQGELKITNI